MACCTCCFLMIASYTTLRTDPILKLRLLLVNRYTFTDIQIDCVPYLFFVTFFKQLYRYTFHQFIHVIFFRKNSSLSSGVLMSILSSISHKNEFSFLKKGCGQRGSNARVAESTTPALRAAANNTLTRTLAALESFSS
jgi:hypothetical protein